jgi:hypothetical protein
MDQEEVGFVLYVQRAANGLDGVHQTLGSKARMFFFEKRTKKLLRPGRTLPDRPATAT